VRPCIGVSTPRSAGGADLDHRDYDVFWAKVEELGVPIFIHPRTPALKYFPMGRGDSHRLPVPAQAVEERHRRSA
jgi:predicted TIM-barrel fold metal-dependent hydrolase